MTIQDVVEKLDLPQRTVTNTSMTSKLRALSSSQTTDDRRGIRLTTSILNWYIDRHGLDGLAVAGLDGLAVALEYAREYVDGSVTHQLMAREQDLTRLEAGVILDALRPIVED